MNGTLIRQALVHYFGVEETTSANLDSTQLIKLLRRLPAVMIPGRMESLVEQIRRHHPGVTLHCEQEAALMFVDEVVNVALRETDLEFKVECLARYLSPLIAAQVIRDGHRAIQNRSMIFELFDLLIHDCQGWSEDLGALGDGFISQWEDRITALVNGRMTLAECLNQLQRQQRKQDYLGDRREQALAADEVAYLESRTAKTHAAGLLNESMAGQRLPLFTVFVLQGAWYQFLQQVATHYGSESAHWRNAQRVTRALVSSLTPDAPAMLRVQVPNKIQDWRDSLRIDTSVIDNCLLDIQNEYHNLDNGSADNLCVADPVRIEDGEVDSSYQPAGKEQMLMRSLTPGQWVLYDDQHEGDREKSARLRLVVNWQAGDSLVFTNLNRRKTLRLSYAAFAAAVNAETIRVIDPDLSLRLAMERAFRDVLEGLRENRRCQRENSAELEAQMRRKKLRAVALRRKLEHKLDAAQRAVGTLRPEAWVKLPIMEGTLTPCRLSAILPGTGTYVFTNRAGVKVGEYSRRQLANMLVTENSEILDTGDEFESILEDVVTSVRESRERGFLELTTGEIR